MMYSYVSHYETFASNPTDTSQTVGKLLYKFQGRVNIKGK